MTLDEIFPHVIDIRASTTGPELYIFVRATEEEETKELLCFLEQNYPMSYTVISDDQIFLPRSMPVSSLVFNGHKKLREEIYLLCADTSDKQKELRANHILFEEMNDSLSRGLFGRIDTLLRMLEVKKLLSSTLLGVVSFSYANKENLVCRDSFIRRAEAEFIDRIGTERTEQLLRNLR
jgi:hypothetical protein